MHYAVIVFMESEGLKLEICPHNTVVAEADISPKGQMNFVEEGGVGMED